MTNNNKKQNDSSSRQGQNKTGNHSSDIKTDEDFKSTDVDKHGEKGYGSSQGYSDYEDSGVKDFREEKGEDELNDSQDDGEKKSTQPDHSNEDVHDN